MAKLVRETQKVFASNSGFDQMTQFGSTANSATIYTTDIAQIQSLSNYLVGWYNAVISGSFPIIQDMNAIHYLYAYQLAYILQQGIAEYDAGTTYYTGSIASNVVWIFTVSSANATVGATYTNNGQTFTVQNTITSGTTFVGTGTGAPTASGTLTKASGTGDSTITFSSFAINAGAYTSIADSNVGNAITDSTHWMPPGVSANSVGLSNLTIPLGYNFNKSFLTIGSGVTYTIAGTGVWSAKTIVNGTLIITGTVHTN